MTVLHSLLCDRIRIGIYDVFCVPTCYVTQMHQCDSLNSTERREKVFL